MTPVIARRRGADGFSLVELMVVLFISAILLGIGIPTYLGARNTAANSAVESNLDAASLTAASAVNYGAWVRPAGAPTFAAAIAVRYTAWPHLTFVRARLGGVSTGPTVISEWRGPTRNPGASFFTAAPDALELSALSATGRCIHRVTDLSTGGWTPAHLAIPSPGTWWTATAGTPCTALTSPPADGRSWHKHAANAANITRSTS